MASACALIFASLGQRRTKLQLLQPIAGRMDSPLFEATAGGAVATPVATAVTAPVRPTAVAASTARNRRDMGPPGLICRRYPTSR